MKQYLDDLEEGRLLHGSSQESESLVVMGTNDLRNDRPKKAHDRFERALEKTHQLPAAWLGKAYANLYLTDDLPDILGSVENSLFKAIEHADTDRSFSEIIAVCVKETDSLSAVERDILLHYLALSTILLRRSTAIIQRGMKKVAAARQKADEARQASSASALATAVGAGIAATSDSRMGQLAWAGGALMASSTSSELQLKAEELSALQKSVWGEVISGCLTAFPFGQTAAGLNALLLDPDDDARKEVSQCLTEWRTMLLTVFKQRLSALKEQIDEDRSALRHDSKIASALEKGSLNGVEELSELDQKIREVSALLDAAAWSAYQDEHQVKQTKPIQAVLGLEQTLDRLTDRAAREDHASTKKIKKAIYFSCVAIVFFLPLVALFAAPATYYLYHSNIQSELLEKTKALRESADRFDVDIRDARIEDVLQRAENRPKATF